ncbi:MAG: hypothetical protein NWQ45_15225 [Congregibacter sp.]|nr:hypothetical protein [Congregibacter sp.]
MLIKSALYLLMGSALATAGSGMTHAADTTGNLADKHMISIGATRQATDITLSATSENFEPSPLTLDDLGVEKRDTSYFIDYRYRITPRWSVFAGAYSFSGAGETINSRDFNFDGVDFTADTQLRADLDIDAYMLDILYSVHRSEKVEVLLGAGLHALDFGVALAGNLQIGDEALSAQTAAANLLAPVPNLRGSATWQLSDRFELNLVGGWLSANVGDYDGNFVYAHLRGFYRFGEHFGASLGYQLTDIDITQTRERSTIDINAQLDGPSLTLTYGF